MKIKFTLDRYASSSRKADVLAKIIRELGSKATVSGDVITVDNFDERKVVEILNRDGLDNTRSSH
jgi:hypothetical protein